MRTALALPLAAAALVAVTASPAAAAGTTTTTSFDHAHTTLLSGDVFVTTDGYEHADGSVGGVEVFLPDAVECFLPEESPFVFGQRGTRAAWMTGSAEVPCSSETQSFTATVSVDLRWTATGPSERSWGRTDDCAVSRRVAPAAVSGSVRVVAPGYDVTLTPSPERPAHLMVQFDRCATG